MKKLFWLMSIIVLAALVIWQIVANSISAETKQRAREYAVKAEAYCQQNSYRTDYCFLVDFDVHSGKKICLTPPCSFQLISNISQHFSDKVNLIVVTKI